MTTRLRTASGPTRDDADAADPIDISRWEPLTLSALLDYKMHLTAPGHGQFALGHVRLWPVR